MKATIDEVIVGTELILSVMEPFRRRGTSKEAARILGSLIYEFIGTPEQLEWFVQAAIEYFAWNPGLPQLRALFCSRFSPYDGETPLCKPMGVLERADHNFSMLAFEESQERRCILQQESPRTQ